MAAVTIRHQPELTAEKAMEIFKKGFAGKYEVYLIPKKSSAPNWAMLRDFNIIKSNQIGMGVKLKQDNDKTTFIYTGMIPSPLVTLLFGGVWYMALNRSKYKAMENEIKTFIENAPEFK